MNKHGLQHVQFVTQSTQIIGSVIPLLKLILYMQCSLYILLDCTACILLCRFD